MISCIHCFFSRKKPSRNRVYAELDQTQGPHTLPITVTTLAIEAGQSSIAPDPLDKLRELTQLPFSIGLSRDKTIDSNVLSTNANIPPFDRSVLSGIYAFALVKDDLFEQHLLLKRFDGGESNHRVLETYLKLKRFKIPIKNPSKENFICGGEIIFHHNELLSWNLKSNCYSCNTDFDIESSLDLQSHLMTLRLPIDCYLSFKYLRKEFYEHFFTKEGFIQNEQIHALRHFLYPGVNTLSRKKFLDSTKTNTTNSTESLTQLSSSESLTDIDLAMTA